MRKIEQDMIDAINNGNAFCQGNTTVTMTDQGWFVTLHGNKIASMRNGNLTVSLAGWGSPVTRNRISVLVREFQNCTKVKSIVQRNWEQVVIYQDGTERIIEDLTEWL